MKRLMALLVLTMLLLSSLALLAPVSGAEGGGIEPNATTTRTVLLELFTGADCPPCYYTDMAVDAKADDYTRDQMTVLVYHRNIPRPDKLQVADAVTRHGWYGGSSTPNLWIDGTEVQIGTTGQAGDEAFIDSAYSTRSAIASQVSMTVDGVISSALTGTVWVNVTALEAPSYTNLFLHTVLVRKSYGPWDGGNGITMHPWVVRKMLPSANGDAFTISSGQTVSKEYSFDLSADHSGADYFTKKDDMAIIAFVQTHTKVEIPGTGRYTAEVLQSKFGSFTVLPNKVPTLAFGQMLPPVGASEDDDVTFKVFYRDLDDLSNKGPSEAKVFFKNATSTVSEHALTPVTLGDPYTTGRWLSWTTKLTPGTYSYRFFASDGEDDATGDTGWNATEVVVKPRNKPPLLMAYGFVPVRGSTSTMFHFDIMYKDPDNERPASAKIWINAMPYDMTTDSEGPWNDWVTYYYETTLPVGTNHKFYYEFSDGIDSTRLPLLMDSPNWIAGPEVEPPNNEPTLTTPQFSPSSGSRLNEFTFSIIYTDGEDDPPVFSYIYIDDMAYTMKANADDYSSGEIFRFKTTLELGYHWVYFMFSDGKNPVRFPPSVGMLDGPTVVNLDPTAAIKLPASGARFTPTDYVSFSSTGTTDPEDDALEYVWTSNIDGQLSTRPAFDKPLSKGEHTITLEVTDENGGVNTTSIALTIKPYLAEPYFETFHTDNVNPVEKDRIKYTVILNNRGEIRASNVEVRFVVDNVQVSSQVIAIELEVAKTISFTWEAEAGVHYMAFEIPEDSTTFTEEVRANTPPTVTPSVVEKLDGSKYRVGDEVYFEATVNDPNGDDVTYLWDFSDGFTATKSKASHIFAIEGIYTVTLTVTDSRGGKAVQTIDVEVAKVEEASSSGSGMLVLAGIIVAVLVMVVVVFLLMRGKPGAPVKDEGVNLYAADDAARERRRDNHADDAPAETQTGAFPEYPDELDY